MTNLKNSIKNLTNGYYTEWDEEYYQISVESIKIILNQLSIFNKTSEFYKRSLMIQVEKFVEEHLD